MKKPMTSFICSSCQTQLRSLTAGRSLRCEHQGVTITADRQTRMFTFDAGRGPMSMTDREAPPPRRDN